MKRDWRKGLSWGFYAIGALSLFAAVYDFVAGRSYLFSAVMAVLFGVLGTGWRVLASQRPKL